MIGRQLPFFALLLPFYVMFVYGGRRSITALWPLLLVAGGSFALCQFGTSNFGDYADRRVLVAWFAHHHHPVPAGLEAGAGRNSRSCACRRRSGRKRINAWQGWLPWLIVTAIVILWTTLEVSRTSRRTSIGPASTTRSSSRFTTTALRAVWTFQPLATGTAILIAAVITSLVVWASANFSFASRGRSSRSGSRS